MVSIAIAQRDDEVCKIGLGDRGRLVNTPRRTELLVTG
jgi:hypothetical protein